MEDKKYANVWNELHKDFKKKNVTRYDDWLKEFEDIVLSVNGEIIDLGCGVTGNNTLYLIEKGKGVVSCDFAIEALNEVSKIPGSKTLLFDMREKFPFEDNYTDLIIADLSLHYFNDSDTKKIISEIKRVLKPGGHLFLRLNSTNSTEYKSIIKNKIIQIEPHFVFSNNMEKRFFDEDDINKYFFDWQFICKREENMARWCPDKIIWKIALKNE